MDARPERDTGDMLTLAHLSDPHLPLPGGVRLRDLGNKRLLGLLSWHLKRRRRHRPEILARLVADMQAHTPDLIAVTGDLTNLGLEAEYLAARAWLDRLGDAARVMTVPGNHDALVAGAWERGAVAWRPYWQGDTPASSPAGASAAFPWLRRVGPLALIGVSSAVVSPAGLAVGDVGAAQRARLARLLRQTRAEGLLRVVLIHHPPLAGTVSRRKHLRDHAAFCAVLAEDGVEMVLHGHSHRSHRQSLPTRDGQAAVIGVPSASSMHHEPAAYNLYRFARRDGGWEVTLTARHLGLEGDVVSGSPAVLRIPAGHGG